MSIFGKNPKKDGKHLFDENKFIFLAKLHTQITCHLSIYPNHPSLKNTVDPLFNDLPYPLKCAIYPSFSSLLNVKMRSRRVTYLKTGSNVRERASKKVNQM